MDDLENIGDLERYIEESAVILIFLSKGYFKSRNCLREVVATLEQSKPYLFVHEADPAKGGASLEVLKLELQDGAHRQALFDEHHRITVWHRIADFQMVSLIQIAEEMLQASPQYESATEQLSLCVPGSLLKQQLRFPSPVVLYVSRNNPGAAEAAEEMRSGFEGLQVTESWLVVGALVRHERHGVGTVVALHGHGVREVKFDAVGGNGETHKYKPSSLHKLQLIEASDFDAEVGKSARSTVASKKAAPTHFLLYLNELTYAGEVGEALAQEVRDAHTAGLPIAMIHENDEARGGCEFGTFFQTTPQDLVESGLYRALAIAFVSGDAHRRVSRALLAKAMGAEVPVKAVVRAMVAEATATAAEATATVAAVAKDKRVLTRTCTVLNEASGTARRYSLERSETLGIRSPQTLSPSVMTLGRRLKIRRLRPSGREQLDTTKGAAELESTHAAATAVARFDLRVGSSRGARLRSCLKLHIAPRGKEASELATMSGECSISAGASCVSASSEDC